MSVALHGHNPEEGLVALQQLDDTTVRLYTKQNGETRSSDERFFPFFFVSDSQYLGEYKSSFWLKELAGSNAYRYLAVFERWSDFWQAIRTILSSYNRSHTPRVSTYNELDVLLVKTDPVTQFLMQSGRTLFKGMTLGDLVRMQIDIRSKHPQPRPGSPRPSDNALTAIALSDSTGWEILLNGEPQGERELITECARIIASRDPDIIEGYGLFDTTLPLLIARAESQDVRLEIGRDGSEPRMITQRSSSGESDRVLIELAGRHLVDTEGLVRSYDYTRRAFEAYTLANAAEHFGFQPQAASGGSPDEFERLLDRVRAIRHVTGELLPSYIALAQFCPLPLGTLTRSGSAQKIESMLLREYLRQKHSVPRPTGGQHGTGGYAALFRTGVIENILYADVESLYPSIMVGRSIRPASDELAVFPELLGALLSLRIQAKGRMKKASAPDELRRADALQSALKILINSFYGYLGYARALFNDYTKAELVTTSGQGVLKEIVRQIELYNGLVIEADTDGVFFVPPDNVRTEEQERAFIRRISESLPEKVSLVPAGKFTRMFSYRKKNYALETPDGQLIIRGSSLVSRSLEPFARSFIRRGIECVLARDLGALHALYSGLRQRIVNHQWEAADFARIEEAHESVDAYTRALESGTRKASPAYEAAKRAQRYVAPGESIAYYVTGSTAGVKVSEHARLAEEWDRNFADENTAYYLERLNDCLEKFRDLFEPEDFQKLFSDADLFGFDPASIRLLIKKVDQPVESSTVADREPGEPRIGIWLDQ